MEIREVFDKFKSLDCAFIISIDSHNNPNGMAVGCIMKCSFDPPKFAVALWNKGNTHKLIQESKEFVVAVPNKELIKELEFFGSTHGDKVDKFKETGLEIAKAKIVNSPLIKKATINFECKLEKEIECGDHILFIGAVVAAHINKNKGILRNFGKINNKRSLKEIGKS